MNYNNLQPQTSSKKKFLVGIIAICAIVGVSVGYISSSSRPSVNPTMSLSLKDNVRELFNSWKIQFNRQYESSAVEEHKFNAFFNNYLFIEEWNADLTRGSTMGLNQFSDLTNAEFRKQMSCLTVPAGIQSTDEEITPVETSFLPGGEMDPPTTVDWRTKGAVTGVKNQGQCGSCWAFSTTGSLEGLNFIKNGNLQSFSEQQLVDCAGSYGNEGCNGGWMIWALNYTSAQGIELESVYPYVGTDQQCAYDQSSVVFKNSGYQNVTVHSESALQAAIAQQPVSVAVDGGSEAFQSYRGGVLKHFCGTQLDHGVLAVGYSQPQKYWIVKNSWGSSWGESGYIRLGWNGDGKGVCGIQEFASIAV